MRIGTRRPRGAVRHDILIAFIHIEHLLQNKYIFTDRAEGASHNVRRQLLVFRALRTRTLATDGGRRRGTSVASSFQQNTHQPADGCVGGWGEQAGERGQ